MLRCIRRYDKRALESEGTKLQYCNTKRKLDISYKNKSLRLTLKPLCTVKITKKPPVFVKQFLETKAGSHMPCLNVLSLARYAQNKKKKYICKYFSEWRNFINLAAKATLQRKMNLFKFGIIKRLRKIREIQLQTEQLKIY